MENSVKIELNKKLRKYEGDDDFLLSLKRQLKSSKNYIQEGNRNIKVLSDRQYSVLESMDVL